MVIVNSSIWSRINEFYSNVETKYHNTWDIDDTIAQINKIEWVVNNFEFVCSWCREPIIQRWKQMGWKETWYKKVPWHFAFERKRIDGIDYIFIQDAEHQDNINESCNNTTADNNTEIQNNMKRKIRLTEGDLHRIVKKCLNESMGTNYNIGDLRKDIVSKLGKLVTFLWMWDDKLTKYLSDLEYKAEILDEEEGGEFSRKVRSLIIKIWSAVDQVNYAAQDMDKFVRN